MRIEVVGYYGMGNYGDELFVEVIRAGAKKYWPSHEVNVVEPSRIAGLVPSERIARFYTEEAYRSPSILGKLSRWAASMPALLRADLVLLAGGSRLDQMTASGMRQVYSILSQRSRTEFAGLGLSFGPFPSEADMHGISAFVSDFQFLALRDEASMARAEAAPLTATPVYGRDLAGTVPLLFDLPEVSREDHVLGVSLSRLEKSSGVPFGCDRHVDEIIEAVVSFAKSRGVEVKPLALNTNEYQEDLTFAKKLEACLADAGCRVHPVVEESDPLRMWTEIARCGAILSTRLHGQISGYMTGVPVVALEYHPKCSDFLDDVGYDDTMRIRTFEEGFLAPAIVRALEHAFERQFAPPYDPKQYARESQKSFTEAPWADVSEPVVADTLTVVTG